MLALQIPEVKPFMSKLLLGDTFDRFLIVEASVTTVFTAVLDGHIHPEFYPEEQIPNHEAGYLFWAQLRPVCLSLIRGQQTPLAFQITFRLSDSNMHRLLAQTPGEWEASEVAGLFLNIKYTGGTLTATTATSLRRFSLDKSLDQTWDTMVKKFFLQKGLPFEEVV